MRTQRDVNHSISSVEHMKNIKDVRTDLFEHLSGLGSDRSFRPPEPPGAGAGADTACVFKHASAWTLWAVNSQTSHPCHQCKVHDPLVACPLGKVHPHRVVFCFPRDSFFHTHLSAFPNLPLADKLSRHLHVTTNHTTQICSGTYPAGPQMLFPYNCL